MLNKPSFKTLPRNHTWGDSGEHGITLAFDVKKASVFEQDQYGVSSLCALVFIMIDAEI
jgi:hypothetical protein